MNSDPAVELAVFPFGCLFRGDLVGSADLRDFIELDTAEGGVYSSSPSSLSTTHESLSWDLGS